MSDKDPRREAFENYRENNPHVKDLSKKHVTEKTTDGICNKCGHSWERHVSGTSSDGKWWEDNCHECHRSCFGSKVPVKELEVELKKRSVRVKAEIRIKYAYSDFEKKEFFEHVKGRSAELIEEKKMRPTFLTIVIEGNVEND